MIAALALPSLLERTNDRRVMLPAAGLLAILLFILAAVLSMSVAPAWPAILLTWAILGIGYSAVQTPTGRLLRRSSQPSDRPALFAAQFALSHACWLITYPLAGWLGAAAGMPVILIVLGSITALGVTMAAFLWPAIDPETIAHEHPDLSSDHPHLNDHARRHMHAFVVDDLHPRWPKVV